MAIQQYVFIVTYARSGSTLLQSLIGSLPRTHMSGENLNALFWLFRSWRAVRQSRFQHGLETWPPNDPWYGADRLRPRSYGRMLAAEFVEHVLRPPPGAERVGFKEIRWFDEPELFVPYLDFVRSFFAPARIVFNSRQADQVSRSGWLAAEDSAAVIARVQAADAMMAAYQAANPADCLHLHYNDYVADPARLTPLFDFLGARLAPDTFSRIMGTRLDHCRTPDGA